MSENSISGHQCRSGLAAEGNLRRLLPLLLVALMVRAWVWMPVLVTGKSMLPTLRGGQLAGLNKLAYRVGPPRRLDVVAVWTGKDLMIKRIVGLPGEEIAARDGTLYINGSPLWEPYAIKSNWNIASGKIDSNNFVVVGDNRLETILAVVNRERIVGRLSFLR